MRAIVRYATGVGEAAQMPPGPVLGTSTGVEWSADGFVPGPALDEPGKHGGVAVESGRGQPTGRLEGVVGPAVLFARHLWDVVRSQTRQDESSNPGPASS